MIKMIGAISEELMNAFEAAGYDRSLGRVTVSNRPDLCEYQCNGSMAGAKQYHKAPMVIAGEVAEKISGDVFEKIEVVAPGFINLNISGEYLAKYVAKMADADKFGLQQPENPLTIVVDYGGANVAKPLHVGHLRPAIIGESVKRICKYMGHNVIGDAHLGDWGLQMGEVIEETKCRMPELPYFDPDFTGEYPTEPPFTIADLEDIYPTASKKMKEDEAFDKLCHEATVKFQKGDRGYRALGRHIINVSKVDLERNYNKLNVHFDLWKGESDADPYIADMVQAMVDKGIAYESQGALVVDIAMPEDKKEYPPCIVRKSDGAAIYQTTDLATLVQREQDFHPDKVIYVVDKRQDLHFIQVFRTARKAEIVRPETDLVFLGFGTMNGKDGKPFKTRDGGILRLEQLVGNINDAVFNRIMENRNESEEKARETAEIVGLAALKYGDLSNQASKDYVFDIDRFASFEGNTGPYILYTIVRIKSILSKYVENGGSLEGLTFNNPEAKQEKNLMIELTKFAPMMESAFEEVAPNKVCAYIYDLANCFNGFYHEINIMAEEDKAKQAGYIKLLVMCKEVLEACIDVLGFEAPERM